MNHKHKKWCLIRVYEPDHGFCLLNVLVEYAIDKGCRYNRDGSGTPPSFDWDVIKVETTTGKPQPEWVTDDMIEERVAETIC